MNTQTEFLFDTGGPQAGYLHWLAARQVAVEEVARRLNLPLGHAVEVWLVGGIRLRGTLRLEEEILFVEEERVRHLPLKVDGFRFTYRELEACIRLD
jgi:hypothetical protein